VEYSKKLEIHLASMWMRDQIRYLPVDKKEYHINILY